MSFRRKPIVGITCCTREDEETHVHVLSDAYVRVVVGALDAWPCPVPAFAGLVSPEEILSGLDALIVTGSRSNLDPARYGGEPAPPGEPQDHRRDATTLPLIRAAVAAAVPLFGVCRGHQEMNVAFGGTLFPRVHEVPGHFDHREPKGTPEEMFALAHPVTLVPGGFLNGLLGCGEVAVNSLHWQGVDRVGAGLVVEARSADGLVEALRVEGAPSLALSVQWHPEWRFAEDAVSRAVFGALASAARDRAARR